MKQSNVLSTALFMGFFWWLRSRGSSGDGPPNGTGGHPEFQVGNTIVFYGATGAPDGDAARCITITQVFADGYRWGVDDGSGLVEHGFFPFALIDDYRAAGGTVEACSG